MPMLKLVVRSLPEEVAEWGRPLISSY